MRGAAITAFYGIGLLAGLIGGYFVYTGDQIDAPGLQMMHVQSIYFMVGIALLIIAAILLSTGALISFLSPRDGD